MRIRRTKSSVAATAFSDKAQVVTILASGLVGYPLGVLYPRNPSYNVTPGDIRHFTRPRDWECLPAVSFLPESPKDIDGLGAGTLGGVVGV